MKLITMDPVFVHLNFDRKGLSVRWQATGKVLFFSTSYGSYEYFLGYDSVVYEKIRPNQDVTSLGQEIQTPHGPIYFAVIDNMKQVAIVDAAGKEMRFDYDVGSEDTFSKVFVDNDIA